MELIKNQLEELMVRVDKLECLLEGKSRVDVVLSGSKCELDVCKKENILMPWTGIVNENCCQGLKVNHGLYNQCQGVRVNEMEYCKSCVNQGIKNGSNIPNYGTVKDRLLQPMMEYVDKRSGKRCVSWVQVMKKLNVSLEKGLEFAKENGIVIPEEQLVNAEKKRGRPKKDSDTIVIDTDEEGAVPKKRGRPKKEKKVMETVAGDDLIANMVANLTSSVDPVNVLNDSGELKEEEIIEEDDTTEVKNLTIDCINYLVDQDNIVYDVETQEEIGTYNPETNSIMRDGL
mgnify:CR=1 FL=1